MTLLVSWVGVDTHGVASAYIASDSRVSWNGARRFDFARKVFALRQSADILGYCGDVLFPSIVLGQVSEMADRGLLYTSDAGSADRFKAIKDKIIQQLGAYPKESLYGGQLQIAHISRDSKMEPSFSCYFLNWSSLRGFSERREPMPEESGPLFVLGSGGKEFKEEYERYKEGATKGTSRSVFHCFCSTLHNIRDARCGGAPQLVGIYRKPGSPARTYGIVTGGQRYFLGAKIDDVVDFDLIEWRNDLFERCDGKTMNKLPRAQSQPDPLRR